jgi:3-deoxy-D-manno-octulosonate 8-phosphate phosphatase (KDO 8-P phosphatase)
MASRGAGGKVLDERSAAEALPNSKQNAGFHRRGAEFAEKFVAARAERGINTTGGKRMAIRELKFPAALMRRARKIGVLLMDVDGTMTRGIVCLQGFPDGSVVEMKVFNAHDGAGIKLAGIMGIRTGLITGRDSAATTRRAREASMEFVAQGQAKKLEAYKAILLRAGVADDEVAYVGDDLPDLPLLERAGLAVAVADAVYEVKKAAHYVTIAKGGEGAVREVVELILKAQGKWKKAIPQAIA